MKTVFSTVEISRKTKTILFTPKIEQKQHNLSKLITNI